MKKHKLSPRLVVGLLALVLVGAYAVGVQREVNLPLALGWHRIPNLFINPGPAKVGRGYPTTTQGSGDLYVDDRLEVAGDVDFYSELTIGTDGTGYDVIFYSDTEGDYFHWDQSAERLIITGTNGANALEIPDGNVVITLGDLDVTAGAFDVTAGATTVETMTVGANTSGADVIFYAVGDGDLAMWDASAASWEITGGDGNTALEVSDGNAIINDDLTVTAGAFDVTAGATTVETMTVGTSGTGADVIFHSDTGGEELTWDTSAEQLILDGVNATTVLDVTDGNVDLADDLDVGGTTNLDVVDVDGDANFQDVLTITSTEVELSIPVWSTSYVSVEDLSNFGGGLWGGYGADLTLADDTVITGTVDVQGGDITLEQDATIANSQANVVTFTVTTAVFSEDVTVTGDLIVAGTTGVDISGGDLILENDEVWSNSTDDVMATDGMLGFLQWISDTTASLTLTPAESGKLIINDGVSGMIYVTLPDSAVGLFYGALAEDDHDIRVEPSVGEQILGCTNAVGDACVLDTQYDAVWVVGTADAWLVVNQVGTLADGD